MSVEIQWIVSITSYIRKTYNLTIGERTAEAIKIEIGSAKVIGKTEKMEIRGRDLLTGLTENDLKLLRMKLRMHYANQLHKLLTV